jgi:hypothetical protein
MLDFQDEVCFGDFLELSVDFVMLGDFPSFKF